MRAVPVARLLTLPRYLVNNPDTKILPPIPIYHNNLLYSDTILYLDCSEFSTLERVTILLNLYCIDVLWWLSNIS